VHATAFAPSGKILAVSGETRRIDILLVEAGFEQVAEMPCAACVRSLAWSSDSSFLVSSGEELQVIVWDVAAERVVFQLPKAKDWLWQVAVNPDSSLVACCGSHGPGVTLLPLEVLPPRLEELLSYSDDEDDAGDPGSSSSFLRPG